MCVGLCICVFIDRINDIYSAATTSCDGGGLAAASFSNFSADGAISCN